MPIDDGLLDLFINQFRNFLQTQPDLGDPTLDKEAIALNDPLRGDPSDVAAGLPARSQEDRLANIGNENPVSIGQLIEQSVVGSDGSKQVFKFAPDPNPGRVNQLAAQANQQAVQAIPQQPQPAPQAQPQVNQVAGRAVPQSDFFNVAGQRGVAQPQQPNQIAPAAPVATPAGADNFNPIQTNPNFISRVGDFLNDSGGQLILGQLAQAFGGNTIGGRLGGLAVQRAHNTIFQNFFNELLQGPAGSGDPNGNPQ